MTNKGNSSKREPVLGSSGTTELPTCFVIMPISDPPGYEKGHFKHVYEDIIIPACEQAGFRAYRADDVKQSNLIHLDILQSLLDAPMAVCDLSSRNPNVLFELALRQAFDKPVALIQEEGTETIFDISLFRFTEYRKERSYRQVKNDQQQVAVTIRETFEAALRGDGINSIVRLLALCRAAELAEIDAAQAPLETLKLVLGELGKLRNDLRTIRGWTVRGTPEKRAEERIGQLRERIGVLSGQIASATKLADFLQLKVALSDCKADLSEEEEGCSHLCAPFLYNECAFLRDRLAEIERQLASTPGRGSSGTSGRA